MANLFFYLFCVFALLTATDFKANKQFLDTKTVSIFELTDLDSIFIEVENESEDFDTLVPTEKHHFYISTHEASFIEVKFYHQPVLLEFSPIRAPPQLV